MATSPILIPDAPAPTPEKIRKEFDLPSGKHVVFLRGTGRDLRLALLAAGNADKYKIVYAIISKLMIIDGKRVTLEGVDDLDFDDVIVLQSEAAQVMDFLGKTKAVEVAKDGTLTDEPAPESPSSL